MKAILIFAFLSTTFAIIHPVSKEIVKEIKRSTNAWTPIEPEENPFAYRSVEHIKSILGTFIQPVDKYDNLRYGINVPENFDAREHWPGYIHPIRDQGQCGSCYAFGASGALSDRFAIASKGAINHVLSPQKVVSWDNWSMGWDGGMLFFVWIYLTETGLPTEECFPYTSQFGNVESWRTQCVDGSEMHYYTSL